MGWTPLHLAASANATKAMRLLLRYGSDPSLISQSGMTALDCMERSYLLFLHSSDFDIEALEMLQKASRQRVTAPENETPQDPEHRKCCGWCAIM